MITFGGHHKEFENGGIRKKYKRRGFM